MKVVIDLRLILPNGNKIELDDNLSIEEKKKVVNDILLEWSDYFTTYRTKKTKVCLEVLSSYLCKCNEELGEEVEGQDSRAVR
ncbi:hypothetical protein M5X17_27285 [Paenibacillus alvei]|uniref:hypothetical protein n=1 Tax=Paenibacillus alvei TaxID=44250 RepID=UPI00227EEF9F|nr:hypothetical protein [Paenibacillus alvei]MCY9737421.1 hypothetical protein [Paenibacillus alvei]